MPNRLPQLPPSSDSGLVYVVQRGDVYKIGFTRRGLERRVRAAAGVLILTMREKDWTFFCNQLAASKNIGYAPSEPTLQWLRDMVDRYVTR